jgi:hypothetical protein
MQQLIIDLFSNHVGRFVPICQAALEACDSAHNSHGSKQAPEGGYPLEESAEPKHR